MKTVPERIAALRAAGVFVGAHHIVARHGFFRSLHALSLRARRKIMPAGI